MKQTTSFSSARLRVAISVALIGILVACGGEQSAGIQGSGAPVAVGATVQGPITGFGSIFVDGVEYATTGAQVTVDGQNATEAQLRVGYIVTLRGTINPDGKTGTATSVTFTQDARGPATQIDPVAKTFTVLGQPVRVTDATLFDESLQPADITALQNGAIVQVSGFPDASGTIVASRVEPASAGSVVLQVSGTVKSLDALAKTFTIGSQSIDFSAATIVGTLAEGSTVNVQGASTSPAGALIASRIEVSGGLDAAPNDKGQVDGVITQFTSGSDFVVDGQRVTTDSSTELDLKGITLALNVPVKVRGTFNASRVLVASRIEVKPQSNARITGLVDSVSASAGTVTVLGVTVTTTAATAFNDKSDQKLKSFKLSDVRTGDYLDVRGTTGGGTALTASVVERQKPDDGAYLQGVASNVSAPNFSVLGITVMTNADTQFVGLGAPSQAAAAFFAQAAGETVRVRGTVVGGVFVADQVKINP